MFIYRKKVLQFLSKPWVCGDELFYISRLPQSDLLQILDANNTSRRCLLINVPIADFIMAQPTNKLRSDAAYFVFSVLQWRDNICIRSAYELDLIQNEPDYSKSAIMDGNSLRIVNGEVWTRTDYELEHSVNPDSPIVMGHRFDQYPGLDYGVTVLPPFIDPRDRPVKRLYFQGWNSTPQMLLRQLKRTKWRGLPAWHRFKGGSEFINRM